MLPATIHGSSHPVGRRLWNMQPSAWRYRGIPSTCSCYGVQQVASAAPQRKRQRNLALLTTTNTCFLALLSLFYPHRPRLQVGHYSSSITVRTVALSQEHVVLDLLDVAVSEDSNPASTPTRATNGERILPTVASTNQKPDVKGFSCFVRS
jgi:hypothetical protein